MGNYRMKLSDMIPNAWFFKLKAMARSSRTHHQARRSPPADQTHKPKPLNEPFVPTRSSYYFSSRVEAKRPHLSPLHPKASDTHFPAEPPRKSRRRSRRKPAISCRHFLPPELELRPVRTNPSKGEPEEDRPPRRPPAGIPGLRVRGGSPRAAAKKAVRAGPRAPPESFAVVKSSSDPEKDFRESMVEMIVVNKIREAKDLEELLACYLSLNSDEYHGVILDVFQQIWFDLKCC
ncbi:hypothetical protein AXF42_Ash016676 [Apostasia shenzhenica]|uniref:Transcription repressor n=1 Tax=Apostasia shenzhenica TaxID=1088818 RepID=A0A2I0APZ8_9ASPA|nr:hypothetical protein AXF42_Ash016676 [Apostasia shenzhenica]